MMRLFLVLLFLSPGWEALAQEMPVTQAALDVIGERGRQLYQYDQAAWHTSQRLLDMIPLENQPETGGWVIEPKGEGVEVTYYGVDHGNRYVLGNFDFAHGEITAAEVIRSGERPPVPAHLDPLIDKREAAVAAFYDSDFGLCNDATMNVYVLPAAADGAFPVYFLASQVEDGVYPIGGHYRFDVNPDNTILSSRRFLNTCLTADMNPGPGGAAPVMYVVAHLLDSTPIEIHVWLSYWMGIPINVLTTPSDLLWKVQDSDISIVGHIDETGTVRLDGQTE